MFRNSLLQRVPGAFRSSEVRSEKLGGINRSWNSMLWMVLAFCNAVLTLTSKRSKHKLILEGCISCFELPSSFMPSCSSSFSVIVHFGFILSPSIFCPFFRRPKFCCVPRSVCLECSSTFCFSGLSYCSSMAAVATTFLFLPLIVLFHLFPWNTYVNFNTISISALFVFRFITFTEKFYCFS